MLNGGQYGGVEAPQIIRQVQEGSLADALTAFSNITPEGNQAALANDPELINGLLGHLKDPNKIVDVKTWLEKISPFLKANLVMNEVVGKAKQIIERGDAVADPAATPFAALSEKVNNLTFEGKNAKQKEEALKEVLIAIVNVGKEGLQNSEAMNNILKLVRQKCDGLVDPTMKQNFENAIKVVEKTFEVRRKALGIKSIEPVIVNVGAPEYSNFLPAGQGLVYDNPGDRGNGSGEQFFTPRESFSEGLQPGAVQWQNSPLAVQPGTISTPIPARPTQLDAAQGPLAARADGFAAPADRPVTTYAQDAGYAQGDDNYAPLTLIPAQPGQSMDYPSGFPSGTRRLEEAARAAAGAMPVTSPYQYGAVPPAAMPHAGAHGNVVVQPPYSDINRRTDPVRSDALYSFEGQQQAQQTTVAPTATAGNVHETTQGALAAQDQQKAQKKDGEVVKFFKSHEGARYTLGTLAVIAAFAAPPVAVALAAALVINELSPILKPVVGVVLAIVVGTFEMLNNGVKAIANLGIAVKNLFSAEKTPYYSMSMEGTKIVFNSFMSKEKETTQAVSPQTLTPKSTPTPQPPQPTPALASLAPAPAMQEPYVGGYTAEQREGYEGRSGGGYAVRARPALADLSPAERYAGTAAVPVDHRTAAVTAVAGVADAAHRAGAAQPTAAADSNRYQNREDRSNLPTF